MVPIGSLLKNRDQLVNTALKVIDTLNESTILAYQINTIFHSQLFFSLNF